MRSEYNAVDFIERIYEAAIATEMWPDLLQDFGSSVGAMGAVFIGISPEGTDWICAPRLQGHMADYASEGWPADTLHTAPLFADTHAGFRAETAYRTLEEIEALPVKREFMIPRGLIAAAASVFPGTLNDALYMTVEGFPSHAFAETAVPKLDLLRPHIGRALSLSAKIRQARTDAMVMGLELAGAGAAVVGRDGKLRAANQTFESALGPLLYEQGARIVFDDRFLQETLCTCLSRAEGVTPDVSSVGVQTGEGETPLVVHLLPLRGRARDVCGSDGVLLLTAQAGNEVLPNADLLRLLFDLTPAESRISRLLAQGMSIAEISRVAGITEMTARTQLRSIFSKTGVRRQAELVRLLVSIRAPNTLAG